MGRKIRFKLLKGSLLQPFLQFTQKVECKINPVADPRGTKIAQHFYKYSTHMKPRYKGENFQAKMDYDLASSTSYIIFHFVNGWKQGYYLKDSPVTEIIEKNKFINEFVAYQRAMQGFEDEYEDQQA